MTLNTAMSGCLRFPRAGLLIAWAGGLGRTIAVGRGSVPIRLVGLPIITAAGITEDMAGPGIRALCSSSYYWNPALVGFFGWGAGGVGFGFGFGNIGWVALTPFETFHPWFGRGSRSNIGRGVVVNGGIAAAYRNARFAGGVTGVHADAFGRGSINLSDYARASSGDLSRGGVVRGGAPFAASGASRQFSERAASTQGMPHMNENAHFFSGSHKQQRPRDPRRLLGRA